MERRRPAPSPTRRRWRCPERCSSTGRSRRGRGRQATRSPRAGRGRAPTLMASALLVLLPPARLRRESEPELHLAIERIGIEALPQVSALSLPALLLPRPPVHAVL